MTNIRLGCEDSLRDKSTKLELALVLLSNIRQCRKGLLGTNTLAYMAYLSVTKKEKL
jgi:hypothetical protein